MSNQPKPSTAAAKNENAKFSLKRETVRSMQVKTDLRAGEPCASSRVSGIQGG